MSWDSAFWEIYDLGAIGCPLTPADLTLRLIVGITADKRYDKESKDISDRSEPYAVCNQIYMKRAYAIGNL